MTHLQNKLQNLQKSAVSRHNYYVKSEERSDAAIFHRSRDCRVAALLAFDGKHRRGHGALGATASSPSYDGEDAIAPGIGIALFPPSLSKINDGKNQGETVA
ncbi:hypothetical protein FACS1894185_3030 [Betaproteobacteria bacterium]|nr:hypothetical protein FACS1894185_3030 [Betaproteobacteria bacterium]